MSAIGPGRVKTLRGITAPRILRLVVTLRAKNAKFLLRSALQPNQISFSHGLGPKLPFTAMQRYVRS